MLSNLSLRTQRLRTELSIVAIICLMVGGAIRSVSQSDRPDAQAQKEVVERFIKVEIEGGRITPQGWQEARKLFVRSSPYVLRPKIFVIGKSYTVWDPMKVSGKPAVVVEIAPIGQIDAQLRFAPPARRYYKNSRDFTLAFTERRWELGAKGEVSKEVMEPSARWLIDEPNDTLMLTVNSAIHYVGELRDATSDQTIKKNADVTLAKLKSIH